MWNIALQHFFEIDTVLIFRATKNSSFGIFYPENILFTGHMRKKNSILHENISVFKDSWIKQLTDILLSKLWCLTFLKFRSRRPEMFLGKSVPKICSKCTGEHPCRRAISPVNLQHIFTAPLTKNTSGRLFGKLFLLFLMQKHYGHYVEMTIILTITFLQWWL